MAEQTRLIIVWVSNFKSIIFASFVNQVLLLLKKVTLMKWVGSLHPQCSHKYVRTRCFCHVIKVPGRFAHLKCASAIHESQYDVNEDVGCSRAKRRRVNEDVRMNFICCRVNASLTGYQIDKRPNQTIDPTHKRC